MAWPSRAPARSPRRLAAPVVTALVVAAVVVAAAVVVVGSFLAVGGSARAASPPASAAPAAAPPTGATPLLSVRRAPGWLANSLAAQRVAGTLAGIVTPAALGKATACLVVEQDGHLLASSHATTPLVPASNLKLLTATAALDRLGPAYRYTTAVDADPAPVGGVVKGNLYLVGGGDPLLRTPQFEATLPDTVPVSTSLPALAAQVRAAGITEVQGVVVGDESRYDSQRSVPTWSPSYAAEGDVGPLSALEVDDGFTSTPAGFIGAADPPQAAAQTFTGLLAAAGVKVDGRTAVAGRTPAAATRVTAIRSAPLAQVLAAILTPSDDTGAELVAKELGKVDGAGGTTAAGTAVIRADLAADGLPVAGVQLVDGSGLDRGDRATCGLLAAVLARAGAGSPLARSLPVAGTTGTLARRLRGTPAAGRVLAKTGTLDDVVALSGFVLPSSAAPAPTLQLRAPVVFSLIMDGVTDSTGVALGDRVAVALADYPVVPALSSLDPLP